jgi:hypothetical protein
MNENHNLIRLLCLYIPQNWEFGSVLVKLRVGGGFEPPLPRYATDGCPGQANSLAPFKPIFFKLLGPRKGWRTISRVRVYVKTAVNVRSGFACSKLNAPASHVQLFWWRLDARCRLAQHAGSRLARLSRPWYYCYVPIVQRPIRIWNLFSMTSWPLLPVTSQCLPPVKVHIFSSRRPCSMILTKAMLCFLGFDIVLVFVVSVCSVVPVSSLCISDKHCTAFPSTYRSVFDVPFLSDSKIKVKIIRHSKDTGQKTNFIYNQ